MTTVIRKFSTKERKTFRVAVMGAKSVGKSALTVRLITQKFIHNYEANLERKIPCTIVSEDETVHVDILDDAALQTEENVRLESKLKWPDAFILMYSITDEPSLSSIITCKCMINLYSKHRRRSTGGLSNNGDPLVILVGNKKDLEYERCVSEERGRDCAREIQCDGFFEISVRESYADVKMVFDYLYRLHKDNRPKVLRASMVSPLGNPPEERTEDELRAEALRRGRSKTIVEYLQNPGSTPSPTAQRKPQLRSRDIEEEPPVQMWQHEGHK